MLRSFLRPEDRRRDAVAHLDEVVEREVGDRVRVRPSPLRVARQRDGPVVVGLGQAAIQLDHVLEGAVHALTVEGHDGVRGVADERGPAADPRPAVDRDQGADRMFAELGRQVRKQLHRVRIVAP